MTICWKTLSHGNTAIKSSKVSRFIHQQKLKHNTAENSTIPQNSLSSVSMYQICQKLYTVQEGSLPTVHTLHTRTHAHTLGELPRRQGGFKNSQLPQWSQKINLMLRRSSRLWLERTELETKCSSRPHQDTPGIRPPTAWPGIRLRTDCVHWALTSRSPANGQGERHWLRGIIMGIDIHSFPTKKLKSNVLLSHRA